MDTGRTVRSIVNMDSWNDISRVSKQWDWYLDKGIRYSLNVALVVIRGLLLILDDGMLGRRRTRNKGE